MNNSFVFFGSSPISVTVLETLKAHNFKPTLIVTKPDSPQGRGLVVTASPVKVWADQEQIKVLTPEKIKTEEFQNALKEVSAPFAILVSYGKIIPQTILDLFPKGIINVHPSLLPLLRGPAPIEYTILNDLKNHTGVSIMLLDSKMDEGPILAQKRVEIPDWPPTKSTLYETLSKEGGILLSEILPDFLDEKLVSMPQDHTHATYCNIIKKEDGEISLLDNPYKNFLKIQAFEGWPGTYFFVQKNEKSIRVKISEASFENNELILKKVIPEGKKEMNWDDFKRNL